MNKKTITLALWILLGLTVIDILNVPSIVINQIPLNFEEISLVGLIIIIGVLLGISYVQWFETMRAKILEMTDKLPIVLLSIVIFYGIINIIPGFELTVFKFQFLCITAIMLVCIIALQQMRKQFPDSEASGNTLQTVFDLHDLNDESKFTNWNPDQFILLKETTVTKDLLNREQTIVLELKRTITNCYYPEGGFVVALTGSWGCGKTTVINLVTKELEGLTIIDDFSFWEYENKEALLKAVIERLLEESDSVLNFFERQAFIQSVLEMVSDKSGFNFVRLFANGDELSRAKNKLSTYLTENNKRILFVVDDLERTNSEIAVMIFKVIATVLDIGNVIYLMSYDEVEMKKHFSTVGIKFNYLDKIINQKFTLPQISEVKIVDEMKKAMLSLAQIYGRTDELKNVIDEVANLLPIENIRDLKRTLNSLMPYIQKNELGLNERDLLMINYIKFKDYGLWEKLASGANYLSYLSPEDYEYDQQNNKESWEEIRKQRAELNAHLSESSYKYILANLFPQALGHPYIDQSGHYFEKNIDSKMFFELYFTDQSDETLGAINTMGSIAALLVSNDTKWQQELLGVLNIEKTLPIIFLTNKRQELQLYNLNIVEFLLHNLEQLTDETIDKIIGYYLPNLFALESFDSVFKNIKHDDYNNLFFYTGLVEKRNIPYPLIKDIINDLEQEILIHNAKFSDRFFERNFKVITLEYYRYFQEKIDNNLRRNWLATTLNRESFYWLFDAIDIQLGIERARKKKGALYDSYIITQELFDTLMPIIKELNCQNIVFDIISTQNYFENERYQNFLEEYIKEMTEAKILQKAE